VPLQEDETTESSDPKSLLMSGKVFSRQLENDEVNFVSIFKIKVVFTTTKILYLLIEIQEI